MHMDAIIGDIAKLVYLVSFQTILLSKKCLAQSRKIIPHIYKLLENVEQLRKIGRRHLWWFP